MDDDIHKFDDRHFIGFVFIRDIIFFNFDVAKFGNDVVYGILLFRVITVKFAVKLGRIANYRQQISAHDKTQRFQSLEIHRMPHCQMYAVTVIGNRQHPVSSGGIHIE